MCRLTLGTAHTMEIGQHANHPGGLRGLLDSLWRMHTRDETAVLGVVIGTEGSTYQKTGALVLLDGNGLRHGVISGGCLEPALEQAARDVHASGRAAIADFDTRSDEDLLFGSGIGCRGRVQLLLLPLPPKSPLARALFTLLDKGVSARLSFAAAGDAVGAGHAAFPAQNPTMRQPVLNWDTRGLTSDEPESLDNARYRYRLATTPAAARHRPRNAVARVDRATSRLVRQRARTSWSLDHIRTARTNRSADRTRARSGSSAAR